MRLAINVQYERKSACERCPLDVLQNRQTILVFSIVMIFSLLVLSNVGLSTFAPLPRLYQFNVRPQIPQSVVLIANSASSNCLMLTVKPECL